MKRILTLASAFLALSHSMHAELPEVYSRSFMYTRPATDYLMQRIQAWNNIFLTKNHGALQLISFAQSSLARNKFALYFLPHCKNEVLISGDENINQLLTRDVRAEYLGLPANFSGRMKLSPRQIQYGIFFEYSQDLQSLFQSSFFESTWFNINTALMGVENDLRLCAFDQHNEGTSFPQNICQAFNQPSWCASKIDGKKSLFRLSEIKMYLGRTYLNENFFQIAYYSTMVVPTGNKPSPEFLFAPCVGNNLHVGLGGGVNFQLLLNRHPENGLAWTFFANIEGIFRVRNYQHRTFDLKCRPWSRFLPLIKEDDPTTVVPGVNVLTLESVVRPYGFADFSFGWHVQTNHFDFEFGYSLWGHGDEKVIVRRSMPDCCYTQCCFGSYGIKGTAPGKTASTSTISNLGPDDDIFIPIREADLDLNSAEARTSLAHTAHTAISLHNESDKGGTFLGFGSFISLEQKNSDLHRWGVWLKAGASF